MKKIQMTSGGIFLTHTVVMLSDKLRHVLTYGYKLRLSPYRDLRKLVQASRGLSATAGLLYHLHV